MEQTRISQRLNLILSLTSINPIDINNNSPLSDLFLGCSDDENEILTEFKIKNEKMLFFFLTNKTQNEEIIIHKYLTDKDKSINISLENFEQNLSNYFYLVELIESDNAIINYVYKFEFIEELNKIKYKGENDKLLYAIIILKLIENYEENIGDINEQYSEKLTEIKEDKSKTVNSSFVISEINLEEIYIDLVFKELLNSEKINEEENKFIEKFIDEFDLLNMNLTKSMYEKLKEYFDENQNNDIKKYMISMTKDVFDEKKINFFYILCKYILKNSYFIYQIDFLLKIKSKIINMIRTKKEEFLNLVNNFFYKEKLKYVLEFLTDSKYYYDKLIPTKTFNNSISMEESSQSNSIIFNSSEYNLDVSKNNYPASSSHLNDSLSTFNSKEKIIRESISLNDYKMYEVQSSEILVSPNVENEFNILTFNKNIMKKMDNISTKQLTELSNGDFLEVDSDNNISIYDKNFIRKFNHFTQIKNQTNNIAYNEYIRKVFETKLEDDDKNQYIYLVENHINHFIYHKINIVNYNEEKLDQKFSNTNNKFSCDQYFNISNNDAIISGNFGIYLFQGINKTWQNDEKIEEEEIEYIKNFKGGLQISNNIFAFVSNDIYYDGKNVLFIYNYSNNQKKAQVIDGINEEKGKYSFNTGSNSLYTLDMDNNYKLLLCACKSYNNETKNGILMIKIDVNRFKTKAPEFLDTEDFEVNCFCNIYQNPVKKYALILVGGFEIEKRRSMVKLYKLSYDFPDDNIKLIFIQDAIEDFSRFEGFDGMINNIIKPIKRPGDIIVSCINGSNYLFNLPTNDYFQFLEEII